MQTKTIPSDDQQRLVDLRWLISENHDKLCTCAQWGHTRGKDVLIVTVDQKTRTIMSDSVCYTDALAIIDDPRLAADLVRLHSRKDHYTVLAYLHDRQYRTYICTIAALHWRDNSTVF